MRQKDVQIDGRRFGKVAMLIHVELELSVDPARLESELRQRFDRLDRMPRMNAGVVRAPDYRPGFNVYEIALPWLSGEQLNTVLAVIRELEDELIGLRRQQHLAAMIEG